MLDSLRVSSSVVACHKQSVCQCLGWAGEKQLALVGITVFTPGNTFGENVCRWQDYAS